MISIQWLMIWHSYFIDYWAIRLCVFVFPMHYPALTHFLSISACGIFLIKSLFPIVNFFYIWRHKLFYPYIVLKSSIFLDMSANVLYFIFLIQNLLMKGCVISVSNGNTILRKSRHIQKLHRQPYLPKTGKELC